MDRVHPVASTDKNGDNATGADLERLRQHPISRHGLGLGFDRASR